MKYKYLFLSVFLAFLSVFWGQAQNIICDIQFNGSDLGLTAEATYNADFTYTEGPFLIVNLHTVAYLSFKTKALHPVSIMRLNL